ncbi:MAG: asparagine synthase (glutamine-hydrolyzing) [Sulfobacillus sp.]
MCGICGLILPGQRVDDTGLLTRMTDVMVHRGPDDAGQVAWGEVGLGTRRLSIVDVAGGRQPILNEDGTMALVANCEIYNQHDLRRELEALGHRFATHSDAEVILHLYEQHGVDGFDRLRGMFAFAIADRRRDLVVVVRDPFGIKPLYYAETAQGVVFASEIRAVLASGLVERRIDLQGLWQYLTFQYVPDPGTLIDGVRTLPPYHYLTVSRGAAAVRPYGELTFAPNLQMPLAEAVTEVRDVMRRSVQAHLMSDVPCGAFLSSGIDSSAVVALMREVGPVSTFSVGFEEASDAQSELAAARATAAALGTNHHEVLISPDRYADDLARMVWYQEGPVADPAAPGIFFLTEVARSEVKVLLSGEGADELFGGYPIYREPLSLSRLSGLPPGVRRQIHQLGLRLPVGMRGRSLLLRGSQTLEERYVGGAKMFSEDAKRALIHWSGDIPPIASTALTAPIYQRFSGLDGPTRMQQLDLSFWLAGDILMKADKMSMANSIELRVPFLDREVFEVARRLPTNLKLADGTTKHVLREAMRSIVPQAARTRPKLGFPVPTRQWFKTKLRDRVRATLMDSDCGGILNRASVEALWQEHQSTAHDHTRRLYTLLVFHLWYDMFIDGKSPTDVGAAMDSAARRDGLA